MPVNGTADGLFNSADGLFNSADGLFYFLFCASHFS